MTPRAWTKGQYVLCRFAGTGNGDVIAGRILSVRKNGDIVLENLLTGKRALKSADVFATRNWVAGARRVQAVVDKATAEGKANARTLAVELYKASQREPRAELNGHTTAPKLDGTKLAALFRALPPVEQQAFSRTVWPEVLSAFGVT